MLIVVPVTALYAGLCALLLLVLAAQISRHRMTLKVGLGDGGHPPLMRAVRVHGNAVEWMLPMLLLLLIAELNHASQWFLHACGIVFRRHGSPTRSDCRGTRASPADDSRGRRRAGW
jgi:uncharacterized membrane protein YecN with MAPEG domain